MFKFCSVSVFVFLISACQQDGQSHIKINNQAHDQESRLILSPLIDPQYKFSAHWLSPSLLVLPKQTPAHNDDNIYYKLLHKENNKLVEVALTVQELPTVVAHKFPHLANFQGYQVNVNAEQAKQWLKQALWVVGFNQQNEMQTVTYVQTGNLLDSLYTRGENDADEITDFGATVLTSGVSFKLWAPTAQQVTVLLFNEDKSSRATLPMTFDKQTGAWQVLGSAELNYAFYQYKIRLFHPKTQQVETIITTDPYSLSLSINSEYSQVIDLNDTVTQPQGWLAHAIPTVNNVEDNIFYETHIRDFSANDSKLSDENVRGKYQAFSEQQSFGIEHLKALQKAGVNNIHLLPTFDIGTVNEDASKVIDINDNMAKVCAIANEASVCQQGDYDAKQSLKSVLAGFADNDSLIDKNKAAQQLVSELRAFDNYNWGYDPFHYTVPEGSYAISADGFSRIVEFRQMVQSIHQLGFRVIMDVVYNHTHHAGLAKTAVLDKIVPNYYHRLDPLTGKIAQSTCCDNTATERVMMAKLMTDSLVTWARDYKIDGFRFDLMGHQPKSAMLTAREAVRTVDSDTYFYGEGWNFGEVANNQRFVQASQLELAGSEIGTYSDRLRDAVRGSGNNTRATQGIGNGLYTRANEITGSDMPAEYAQYLLKMDQLRIGLAGNLANYPLTDSSATATILGKDIPYGDQPTGYALDPADTINYVSKHDNQTLWDNSQYRVAFDVSTENRVRMQLQSLSFVLFAQGIPFIHMGSELLRSKAFLRDSYDYGDWFNGVDFSKQTNFYNQGLPPAEKDQDNWPLIEQVRQGHQGRDQVTAADIQFSSKVFNEMVAIRSTSSLFRLTTEQAIIEQVHFLNRPDSHNEKAEQLAPTGLLVMKITAEPKAKYKSEHKPEAKTVIVLFNTSAKSQKFYYEQAQDYMLHPIQQHSVDKQVRESKVVNKHFIVPAYTSAVFVVK